MELVSLSKLNLFFNSFLLSYSFFLVPDISSIPCISFPYFPSFPPFPSFLFFPFSPSFPLFPHIFPSFILFSLFPLFALLLLVMDKMGVFVSKSDKQRCLFISSKGLQCSQWCCIHWSKLLLVSWTKIYFFWWGRILSGCLKIATGLSDPFSLGTEKHDLYLTNKASFL